MLFDRMRVRLTFIDELLGTASGDPDIHRSYIASKAPDAPSKEEEVASIGVDAEVEKGMTVFSRDEDGNPCMWGYQIRGFFKAACAAMAKVAGSESSEIKAYKKLVDQRVFVYPDYRDKKGRKIKITNINGEIGDCQRPLRASTPQGERVAIAHSESIAPGAQIEFDIVCIENGLHDLILEWLEYGSFNGLGQWRNSGKGAFTYEIIVDEMKSKKTVKTKKKSKKTEDNEE